MNHSVEVNQFVLIGPDQRRLLVNGLDYGYDKLSENTSNAARLVNNSSSCGKDSQVC